MSGETKFNLPVRRDTVTVSHPAPVLTPERVPESVDECDDDDGVRFVAAVVLSDDGALQ